MSYTHESDAADLPIVREHLTHSSNTVWLGAMSFEERCTASLSWFETNGINLTRAFVLNYSTPVYPAAVAERRRLDNWRTVTRLVGSVIKDGLCSLEVEPYAFQELQELYRSAVLSYGAEFVIFDITCMTKIHVLALAAVLAQGGHSFDWAVAYTAPENYGTLVSTPNSTKKGSGWRDIIVAPLADTASLFNESHSRGIIMTGHEADRLIVGLAELEPSGGLIINTDTPHRPDLRYLSERLNRKIIRQLTRMRASNWETKVVGMADFCGLKKFISRELILAQEYRAPIILFPYGPKSLLFAAAMQLSSEYPSASWFVYPVPSSYDVNYTEGIESTIWLTQEHGLLASQATRYHSVFA